MDTLRFLSFVHRVDDLQKAIKRLEVAYAPAFGVKGVHVFWLYELLGHPDGLTAAELANKQGIDRSLVSREIAILKKEGLVEAKGGVRGYNARLTLTEKGRGAAEHIQEVAYTVQCIANEGVSVEELQQFYRVFDKLRENLHAISHLTQAEIEAYISRKKENSHENAEA